MQEATSKRVRKTALVIIAVLAAMLAFRSEARAGSVVELDESSLVYRDYLPGGFDPLITDSGLPNRTLGKALELNLDTSIAKVFYFNSLVHSMTDEIVGTGGKGQFRVVGLQMELGLRVSSVVPIDVFYLHHSQHTLDHEAPFHFPVNDSVGVRIVLFKKTPRETLLP